jgi:hypothetical protein
VKIGHVLAAAAILCATGSFGDLLSNSSLEGGSGLSDLPDWTAWGGSGTLEGSYYNSGSQSVRFWFNDTGLFQDFAATPGEEYETSGYLYTPSGGEQYTWDGGNLTYACIKLEWHRADDSLISYTESDHFTPDNTPDVWTQVSAQEEAPAETSYGRVTLLIDGAGPGSGTVAFDDVDASVVAIPEPTTLALFGSIAGIFVLRRKLRR